MKNIIFFLFLLKTLITEAVLTSTHDLCFGAKIRKKNVYRCKPQFYSMKVGCKGVFFTQTCFLDVGPAFSHSMASCDTMLQYDAVLWGTVQSVDFSPAPLPQLVISEPPCYPTLLPLTFPAVVPPGIVLYQRWDLHLPVYHNDPKFSDR